MFMRMMNYLPQKDMNIAKKTVAGLSKRYVSRENKHDSPNLRNEQALSHNGHSVMLP